LVAPDCGEAACANADGPIFADGLEYCPLERRVIDHAGDVDRRCLSVLVRALDPAVDARIRERFSDLHRSLMLHPISATTPEAAVAAVIVLDQFSRNMFRGTPTAYAADPLALELFTGVIEGWIKEYPEQWLWLQRRWR
jgi:hypothetical protein